MNKDRTTGHGNGAQPACPPNQISAQTPAQISAQTPAQPAGKHALVIGGSIGGLLAARVLSEHYERVTLLDRDALPNDGSPRKGVPQGRHAHGLLGRGREVFEELFPGLTDDLVAQGARSGDTQQQVRWYGAGQALAQAPSGLRGLAVSRPLLESAVRARLLALPGVTVLEQASVTGLEARPDGSRVTGVRVQRRSVSADLMPADQMPADQMPEVLSADLVVDASGRGSACPRWLSALGYPAPQEEQVRVGIHYASAHFRRYPDDLGAQTAVIVAATPRSPFAAAMIAQEGERWIVSLGGLLGEPVPTDLPGFLAFARRLPAPELSQIIGRGELLGEIVAYAYPASVRRHYERLRRFPGGLLVFGDALCHFNPVYGQGMTSAGLQALALRGILRRGADAELARRFFRAAAKVVAIPWSMAVGNDLQHPGVPGRRSVKLRVINAYLARLLPVAWHDPVVARAFLRVTNLLAPPTSLLSPHLAWRVWRGQRVARRAPLGTSGKMV